MFLAPDIATVPTLPEGESHHAVKVLRMAPGDELDVVDGRGTLYRCRLLEAHAKHATVEILSAERMPLHWAFDLTVAVAPTKHLDRMEWLMEKLTEVGVNRFIPLLCSRSERRELKTERLEKIAVSAMKQSLKAFIPAIEPMTPVAEVVRSTTARRRYICHCMAECERLLLTKQIVPGEDTIILIGPEGDFSPAEVELALSHGFVPVSLGDMRLRTESAALFAATAVHVVNQLNGLEQSSL